MPAVGQQPIILVHSPLAIQGVILEVVRQRFANKDTTFPWKYIEGDMVNSDIDIRIGFNPDDEGTDKRPVISIYRGDLQAPKQVIDNRMSIKRNTGAYGFGSMTAVQIFIGCLSTNLGEAELLGDAIFGWILANRKIIEKAFSFHEVSNPVLMAPRPFERDKRLTEVPVTFNILNMTRWATMPVAPLLEEIVLKLGSQLAQYSKESQQMVLIGEQVFQTVAINSITKD